MCKAVYLIKSKNNREVFISSGIQVAYDVFQRLGHNLYTSGICCV